MVKESLAIFVDCITVKKFYIVSIISANDHACCLPSNLKTFPAEPSNRMTRPADPDTSWAQQIYFYSSAKPIVGRLAASHMLPAGVLYLKSVRLFCS